MKFASGDKFKGTPEEYKDVSIGMSVHFGKYTVDPVKHELTLMIDRGSFPNSDNSTQVRTYELNGDVLSWKVAPRKDGSIPVTRLKRLVSSPTKRISVSTSGLPTGTSAAVWNGNTLYVSGWLDPDIKSHPTTEMQTVSLIKDIQKFLETQGLTLGDVMMMHVYLGGDPSKEGKMDFSGMMAGYTQFFGTDEQPNKPARTTVQVVLPAGSRGGLIEIDLIAVRQ